MTNITRHIGRYANSGSRVIVVFRKIDGDENYCLVLETDTLPDMVQDNVMHIVNSSAGQKEVDFYQTLSKSTLSDGNNALTALHQRGLIKKVAVSMVEMLPMNNRPVSLTEINLAIDGKAPEGAPVANDVVIADTDAVDVSSIDTGDVAKNASIAIGLIAQAEMMESDAASKRAQAIALDPSLAPKVTAKVKAKLTPKAKVEATVKKKVNDGRLKSEAAKAATLEARNERRRVAYDAKKAAKVDAKIDAQVKAKIKRDSEFAGETK